MASPVVSGAIAVWAERYVAETGQQPDRPALVKATFTAAARDLEGGNQCRRRRARATAPTASRATAASISTRSMNHGPAVRRI
ncbi:MAG: hypothetical protein U5L08_04585 [Xanthomonadales bacterium]|nr:hypothetical protein [Xanthomonadales bacterium]